MRCFCTAKSDKPTKTIDFLRDYKVFSSHFVSTEIPITLPHEAGELVIPRLLVLPLLLRHKHLDATEPHESSASVFPGDLQSSPSLMTRIQGSRRAFDFGGGAECCLCLGTE